ncbi:MAG: hypothetical protein IID16_12610 [Candidatus Marinimicrobia bacterium]|nr:hypothetical protein [Candidatus Neomarinimicrobiota bacterium]
MKKNLISLQHSPILLVPLIFFYSWLNMTSEEKLNTFLATILDDKPKDEYGYYNLILTGQCLGETVNHEIKKEEKWEDKIIKELTKTKLIKENIIQSVLAGLKPLTDKVIT